MVIRWSPIVKSESLISWVRSEDGENNEDGLIGSIMGHFEGHVSLGIDFGRVLWLVLVITSGKWIIDRSVRVNNDVTRAQRGHST